MKTIAESWNAISSWAESQKTGCLELPSGMDEADISQAEDSIGISLPDDVRESYLLHNGSGDLPISSHGRLMPLSPPKGLSRRAQHRLRDVVGTHGRMCDMLQEGCFDDPGFAGTPSGPICTDWWNVKWLPITWNDTGDFVCIDFAPPEGGAIGQVFAWWHEGGALHLLGGSFAEWMSAMADAFEAGRVSFNPETESVEFPPNCEF